ncbi:MAG: ATP-binding protein [bacterium]
MRCEALLLMQVQVRIYDSRLEVWNPGNLPPELTIAQLYHEHSSHPRNPRLAGAFHHAGLIERWGTGTLRIITACQVHGIGQPEFSTMSGNFIVRFRALAGTIISNGDELNERQKRALEYVREHGLITVAIYKHEYNVSECQARRDMALIVKHGDLRVIGKGSATSYILKDDGE